MGDLAVALGLVLVFEGLLWALAPGAAISLLEAAAAAPQSILRRYGWIAVAIGLLIVWLVRG
jgi:uncharacterized protein